MERLYRIDQDVLDERGIDLSVEEVVGLPTSEYSVRLRRLNLSAVDAAFVKSLRRRIKNRMASQNSRRRTAEHIRSLTSELRAVRASKEDMLEERGELFAERAQLTAALRRLCRHITEKLKERGDDCELPFTFTPTPMTSNVFQSNCISTQSKLSLSQTYVKDDTDLISDVKERSVFECRLESLVQRSVHHMYKFEIKGSDPSLCKDVNKQIDTGPESKFPADENEPKDLIRDMAKLNNFAAEICKPKCLGSDASCKETKKISVVTNMEGEACSDRNGVETCRTNGAVAEKRKAKLFDCTAAKISTEGCKKKNIVDIFKIPPKDPINETPKIVRAKCVAIAPNDGREELNARKPRKRTKEVTLREAKQATFKEIMESTYKEIQNDSLRDGKKDTFSVTEYSTSTNMKDVYPKDEKNGPFVKDAMLKSVLNSSLKDMTAVSIEPVKVNSLKEVERVSMDDFKESLFKKMTEASLKYVSDSSFKNVKERLFLNAKETLFGNAYYKNMKDALLRDALESPSIATTEERCEHDINTHSLNGNKPPSKHKSRLHFEEMKERLSGEMRELSFEQKRKFEDLKKALFRKATETPIRTLFKETKETPIKNKTESRPVEAPEATDAKGEAPTVNGCIVHTSDDQYNGAGALNLSVRGERRHHGRKQAAPRRIVHEDVVLDLKIRRSD